MLPQTVIVKQMLAMCVWKERRSDDTDNIRRTVILYKLDSDQCADQYYLLRNGPSVKNVTSLKNMVKNMVWRLTCTVTEFMKVTVSFINWPHFSYYTCYQCWLWTSMQHVMLSKERVAQHNGRWMTPWSNAAGSGKEHCGRMFADTFAVKPRKLKL